MAGTDARTARILAAPATLVMLAFFVVPTALLVVYSFWTAAAFQIRPAFELSNYADALASPLFWRVTLNSLVIGLGTAAVTLLLALPVGYYLVYVHASRLVLNLVLVTWFSSYLVRIYAWRTLLGTNGVINTVLQSLGVTDAPIAALLFNSFAVVLTLVHIYLPFCILLVVASLSEVKRDLLDASRDLGTSSLGVFVRVIAPNAASGLVSAFMLTFILVAGDYVTPQMLGGASGQTTSLLIADQFRKTGDWPLGAAQAVLMVALVGLVYLLLVGLVRVTGLMPRRRSARARGIA